MFVQPQRNQITDTERYRITKVVKLLFPYIFRYIPCNIYFLKYWFCLHFEKLLWVTVQIGLKIEFLIIFNITRNKRVGWTRKIVDKKWFIWLCFYFIWYNNCTYYIKLRAKINYVCRYTCAYIVYSLLLYH